MTVSAIRQYLTYKWKAKGLHGTHSPFVYAFIENVVNKQGAIERQYLVEFPEIALRFENILSRMAEYYHYRVCIGLPIEEGSMLPEKVDMLLLRDTKAGKWAALIDKYQYLLKNDSVIVLPDIHSSKGHADTWKALAQHPKVKMSIDLYGIGLLLFKEEFKEQQHFVLRY